MQPKLLDKVLAMTPIFVTDEIKARAVLAHLEAVKSHITNGFYEIPEY